MPLILKNRSFAELYKNVLFQCLNNSEYESKPRNYKIYEITNVCLQLEDPNFNWFKNEYRKDIEKYLKGELIWYFTGDNKIEFISKYSKFWEKIANADGTANSAYGNLIFKRKNQYNITEWQWAIQSLKDDKDSRQAIIHFNTPDHLFHANKDQVCTMYGIFLIRNNALNFHIYMRSNDVIKGLTYDVPFFTLLQLEAWKILVNIYPELKIGSYFHNATSLHLYENDISLCKQIISSDVKFDMIPISDFSLIDKNGNCTKEFFEVINKSYVGNDKFFNWLQS